MKRISLIVVCLLFCAASLHAQLKKPEYVRVVPPMTAVKAALGASVEVPVYLSIVQGYHINADKPTFDYMIATKLDWISTDLKVAGITYPPAVKKEFEFSPGEKVDVYEGDVKIVSKLAVPKTAKPGALTLQGKVRYQACDHKACYPPVTVPFEAPVEIVKK